MRRRLLVPLTDARHSWPGLEHALTFYPDPEITVVNVVDPAGAGYGERSPDESGGSDPDDADRDTLDTQAELFAAAEELAADYDVTLETAVLEGRPAEVIVEYAAEHDFDAIVMGSRGRTGVSRVLLGSVAGTVVQNATVPVTVVP